MNIMKFIGYVFNSNGTYTHKYYFEGTIKKMAIFILQFPKNNTMITDSADEFICSSMYGFLDKVVTNLRDELLKELLPLQMGSQFTEINFIESDPYSMEER